MLLSTAPGAGSCRGGEGRESTGEKAERPRQGCPRLTTQGRSGRVIWRVGARTGCGLEGPAGEVGTKYPGGPDWLVWSRGALGGGHGVRVTVCPKEGALAASGTRR